MNKTQLHNNFSELKKFTEKPIEIYGVLTFLFKLDFEDGVISDSEAFNNTVKGCFLEEYKISLSTLRHELSFLTMSMDSFRAKFDNDLRETADEN